MQDTATSELAMKENAEIQKNEQFFMDTVSKLINAELTEVNIARRGFSLAVNMPESVDRKRVEEFLRDGVDVCFSRSFAGFVNGTFTQYSSIHEVTLDLASSQEGFSEELHGKVIPHDSDGMNFADFIMSIEVFDTAKDPNWGFPIITVTVQSDNLNAARLLSSLK